MERGVRLVLVTGVGFLVARHLGPDQLGLLSTALALVGCVVPLVELGLELTARRELIQHPHQGPVLMGTVGALRLSGGLVAAVLLVLVLWLSPVSPAEGRLVCILGITLFQPALCMADTWFQARLEARFSVLVRLAALFVGAMARIWLVARDAPLAAFAWVVAGEAALTAGLFMAVGRCQGLRYGGVDRRLAGRMLKESWPLLVAAVAVLLYMRIDVVMLRVMSGERAAGIYAAAMRFTEVWYFLPGALTASLLPRLLTGRNTGEAEYQQRLQQCYDLGVGLGYAISIPTALAAPILVRLGYGRGFEGAAPVVVWHAGSLVFVLLNAGKLQFLANEGKAHVHLLTTLAGLLANVSLNLVLIPRYGAVGAAAATLATQMMVAWGATFCFPRLRGNAWMQTRALLIPLRWPAYVFRR